MHSGCILLIVQWYASSRLGTVPRTSGTPLLLSKDAIGAFALAIGILRSSTGDR
jgi:hypothetical protein